MRVHGKAWTWGSRRPSGGPGLAVVGGDGAVGPGRRRASGTGPSHGRPAPSGVPPGTIWGSAACSAAASGTLRRGGRPVAGAAGWCAGAFTVGARNARVGRAPERQFRWLRLVANNYRFLALAEDRVPNPALQTLACRFGACRGTWRSGSAITALPAEALWTRPVSRAAAQPLRPSAPSSQVPPDAGRTTFADERIGHRPEVRPTQPAGRRGRRTHVPSHRCRRPDPACAQGVAAGAGAAGDPRRARHRIVSRRRKEDDLLRAGKNPVLPRL